MTRPFGLHPDHPMAAGRGDTLDIAYLGAPSINLLGPQLVAPAVHGFDREKP